VNATALIARSLWFYRRTHVGLVLGVAVACAVLVGALIVGDSVRGTLRRLALARLGRVQVALAAEDRLFRAKLAEDMATELSAVVAPVLQVRGIAASDTAARVSRIQVLGVDRRFWSLARAWTPGVDVCRDGVVLNERLADRLRVKPGETVLLRTERPSLMPRDAPLATDADASRAIRLTVRAVTPDDGFGRFSLRANQIAPYNAFVPLATLQERLDLPGRANVLLVGGAGGGEVTPEQADALLRRRWRLADAGLELVDLPDQGSIQLRSAGVFLDQAVERAARAAAPDAVGILAYFANEMRLGERTTPYSVVAAVEGASADSAAADRPRISELIPPDLADQEIIINAWLADDLAAGPGDELHMTYFVFGPMRSLREQTHVFRVRAVVPLEGPSADPSLMPTFPGVSEVKSCRDWEPGFPIDLARIRKKDEKYWDEHRGTPKAFVGLRAGQRIWANRFGNLTALRWPRGTHTPQELAEAIRRGLDPAEVGLFFQPVRRWALAASAQAMDFGLLFLGLSFFLLVAALLLAGLLFVFGIEQRSEQMGTLLALGIPRRRVRRWLLVEGMVLAGIGVVLGSAGGVLYTRAMLHGLSTLWRGAVPSSAIVFHAKAATILGGAAMAFLAAVTSMSILLRRQGRRPARLLLAGMDAQFDASSGPSGRRRDGRWVTLPAVAAALVLVVMAGAGRDTKAAVAFFTAGALLVVGCLAWSHWLLGRLGRPAEAPRMTLAGTGVRNCSRRRGRSLAVVALLACGSFLVIAVGANRRGSLEDAHRRGSGTGGFALYGESALPVLHDLASPAGREAFGLDAESMRDVRIVHLRLREGDEASCLNLNRPQTPRLLGVPPAELASRGAFTFVRTMRKPDAESPWSLLGHGCGDGVVPAVGDVPTVTWALGKSVGDTLAYTDERGREFRVRIVGAIAGSILQGSLLISERDFQERFPSVSGYRTFLIDCPPERTQAVREALSRSLQDVGLELTPTTERLSAFNAVENTYLSIFQVLGGLGLLLGSVGLGVVVLRNVLERRGELALLRAVGFSRGSLQWLILCEHGGLLLLGLAGGVVSAFVAVLPALRSPGVEVPYAALALTLFAVVASAAAWTWLAAVLALRGPLLAALRNE